MRRFSSQSGTALAGAYCTLLAPGTSAVIDGAYAPASAARRAVRASASGGSRGVCPGSRSSVKRSRIAAAMMRDLELAEAHPEADPRAAAERHVGAARDLLALAREEALGPERVRLLPHVGQPVRGPRAVVDRHAGGDAVAVQLERPRASGAGRSRPAGTGAASRRARSRGRPSPAARASSQNRNEIVAVVVSWPANSSVITWSRTCRSESSVSISSESTSSPRAPGRAPARDLAVDELVEPARARRSAARTGVRGPRSTCSQ